MGLGFAPEPLPSYSNLLTVTPKIFSLNTGANLCKLAHFGEWNMQNVQLNV